MKLRFALLLMPLALAGCSDDDPSASGAAGAPSSSSAAGSGGAGATGGGSDGGSGALGGGGGSGGSATSDCVDADVLDTLQQHLESLTVTAQLMATHPGPLEATGFLLAPGLPSPPAISNVFAGPLIMECTTAMSYVEYCEEGRCSQIECTGDGAGWIMHHWVEPTPFVEGSWSFAETRADTRWADGATGVTFELDVSATGEGKDWSMTGTGQMDLELMEVTEQYPGLFEAGAAEVTYTSAPAGTTGEVVVDGVTVAVTDAQGQLQATGDCPAR